MNKEDIEYVSFWRRNANAVDRIDSCFFRFLPRKGYEIQTGNRTTEGSLTDEECDKIAAFLESLDLEKDLSEFRAFDYESDKQDFSLSFFLKVLFRNKIYFAVKGCSPRKEKHFHEILAFFGKIIQEKGEE